MPPLISVIVPVYKVEPYLYCCVDSIVKQTYTNLEIILVDDGSPDACGSMCDIWAEKDSRIQVIHKENGGLSDARNAGIALATGEYICFVDSDDWLEPEFLSVLYQRIIDTGADIAECATRLVDESGNELRCRGVASDESFSRLQALRRLVLEDGIYQTVWNKLYRRDVIEGILFEKGKCNEDDFWTYQIFDRANLLTATNRPLYNYLQRGNSIMGVGYSLKRLDGLEARFRRMEYLQKYDSLAVLTRQQLLSDCLWHYQRAISSLNGSDIDNALRYILWLKEKTPPIGRTQLIGKLRHRTWIMLFTIVPQLTAKIRNKLGIGQ